MQIHVKLFAMLRDIAGRSDIDLDVPEGTTAGALLDQLFSPDTRHQALPSAILYAVNQQYAASDHVLQEGDEVALVPPVSGG